MAQFKTLIEGKIGDREDAISQQWETMNLLQQTIDNRAGKQDFVFYEGPPTANGRPGIHHVLARTLKDTVCK